MISCEPKHGYFQIHPICGGRANRNHRGHELHEVEETVNELRQKVSCKLIDAARVVGEIIEIYVSFT